MSIKILKQQAEYSPLSTSIYVRTLRSYSLVQFVTYGPLIIFLIIKIFGVEFIPLTLLLEDLKELRTLATLSGFFNTLIFIIQGAGTLKAPVDPIGNNLDADLTLDTA